MPKMLSKNTRAVADLLLLMIFWARFFSHKVQPFRVEGVRIVHSPPRFPYVEQFRVCVNCAKSENRICQNLVRIILFTWWIHLHQSIYEMLTRSKVDENPICVICFEELNKSNRVYLSNCHHSLFCTMCLEIFFTSQITDRKLAICCPEYKCKKLVNDVDIKAHTSKETFKKYKILKANIHFECSECNNHVTFPRRKLNNPRSKICDCGKFVCSLHGCDHDANETCAQYVSRVLITESETRKDSTTLLNYCQQCPNCGVFTERNGGCHNMVSLLSHIWYCIVVVDSYCWHTDMQSMWT